MKKYMMATALALVLGTAAFSSAQAVVGTLSSRPAAIPAQERWRTAITEQKTDLNRQLVLAERAKNPDLVNTLKIKLRLLDQLEANPNFTPGPNATPAERNIFKAIRALIFGEKASG